MIAVKQTMGLRQAVCVVSAGGLVILADAGTKLAAPLLWGEAVATNPRTHSLYLFWLMMAAGVILLRNYSSPWVAIGYGFVLGGSLANAVDRLNDPVVDFIALPVAGGLLANVADLGIFAGVSILFTWALARIGEGIHLPGLARKV